jgi:hypothetical protein
LLFRRAAQATKTSAAPSPFSIATLAGLFVIALSIGCQSGKPSAKAHSQSVTAPPASAQPLADPLAQTGGCDAHLQDIAGLFLMYSLQNHRLPDSLDELKKLPGAADVGDFNCPVSGKPYLYNREGIPTRSGSGRIILYDAEPTHHGQRLALVIQESAPGGAMVTKVVELPESFFQGK